MPSSDDGKLSRFLEVLWTAPLGIAALANFADSIEKCGVVPHRVSEFLVAASQLFDLECRNGSPGDGLHAYRCLIVTAQDPAWHFERIVPVDSSTLSNTQYAVTTSNVVFFYHFDIPATHRSATKLNIPNTDWPTRIKAIETLLTEVKSGWFTLIDGAALRGATSLVWLSGEDISDGDKPSHEQANRFRDRLGLLEKRSRTYLVRYKVEMDGLKAYRPNPMHCLGERFRVQPDDAEHQASGLGWTVDLERLAENESVLDGCDEVVANAISITEEIRKTLEPLGMVLDGLEDAGDRDPDGTCRGELFGIDDHAAFAGRLRRARTKDQIFEQLRLPKS